MGCARFLLHGWRKNCHSCFMYFMYDPNTVIALFHVVTAKILTFAIFQQIITTSDRQLGQRGPKQNNLRFTFSKAFLLWSRHQVALHWK